MRLVCVVEVGCTFASEFQMLALVLSHWNVSGPATISNLPSSDWAIITYGPKYPRLVELDMKRAQASTWLCCPCPLRSHPPIARACSICH
jgi:hypothetical protein